MQVTSHMIVPVKKNGKWTTYIKEYQEEIPDLGRHRMMCNKCGNERYPDCRSWCPVCLLYTSPSPRDRTRSRMPSSA